jgi:glycosyltransferase involved in cell wall biosynthesis
LNAQFPKHDRAGVLALIPAWNEGIRIGPVVAEAAKQLPVLVVDDGSSDETAERAADAGAIVVRHEENLGKGRALVTGFQWGMERGYDAIITLDADGQHDPVEITTFLAAYQSDQGDLIIGRRIFGEMPFKNRFGNTVGSFLLSKVLRQSIYDNQSGYRLHTRRLLEALDLKTGGFELEVEVIIQTVCKGMRICWVDIRTIYGINKVSYFHPIHDSLRFIGMIWHAYRYRVGSARGDST